MASEGLQRPLGPSTEARKPGDVWTRPFEPRDRDRVLSIFIEGVRQGGAYVSDAENNRVEWCSHTGNAMCPLPAESFCEVSQRWMWSEPITIAGYTGVAIGLGIAKIGPIRWLGGLLTASSALWVLYWRHRICRATVGYSLPPKTDDLMEIERYYAMSKAKGDDDGGVSAFWVAETMDEDGKTEVVGCLALGEFRVKKRRITLMLFVSPTDSRGQTDKTYSELRRMSVSLAHRGKGIAGLLLRTLIDHAKEKGLAKVVLLTTTYQAAAIVMYQRYGWVEVETRRFLPFIFNARLHVLHLNLTGPSKGSEQ